MSSDLYKIHLIYEYFVWNEIKYIEAVNNIERTIRSGHFTADDVYRLARAQIEREVFSEIMREIFMILHTRYIF